MEQPTLAQWLKEWCQKERLSLRQAAARTGLSHVTIADIMKGRMVSAQTIGKLARSFGGDGHQGLALEDELMVLAGLRTPRPQEQLSQPLAELLDKLGQISEPQLKLVGHFVDFLVERIK